MANSFNLRALGLTGLMLTACSLAPAVSVTSFGQTKPSAQARTLESGAYSRAQQKRGAAIYNRECSTCHGETLEGGEGSPPLAGSAFRASYGGRTVAVLFDKIRTTMPAPPEQPGKLTPEQNADVVAHILSINGFPAGDRELSTDLEELKRLVIPPPGAVKRISAGNVLAWGLHYTPTKDAMDTKIKRKEDVLFLRALRVPRV
jgi:mono/diheme cytochrome c family protein